MTLFIPTVGLLVGLTALPRLAFPEAAASGRLYGVVWHRAFIGFGVNPAWPFAGMRDKYDCAPQVPEGLRPWVVDLNCICVWFSYGPNGARTVEAIGGELYDSHYEVALRHAFFDVIQSHPRDAFETLLIFKPKLIIKVLSSALYPRLSDIGHKILPLIILQMLVFTVYIAARPTVAPFNTAAHQFCILFLFMTAALIPQILTFTAAHTAIDLLTYTIGGWVILFALLVSCASSLWRRRPLIGSRF